MVKLQHGEVTAIWIGSTCDFDQSDSRSAITDNVMWSIDWMYGQSVAVGNRLITVQSVNRDGKVSGYLLVIKGAPSATPFGLFGGRVEQQRDNQLGSSALIKPRP